MRKVSVAAIMGGLLAVFAGNGFGQTAVSVEYDPIPAPTFAGVSGLQDPPIMLGLRLGQENHLRYDVLFGMISNTEQDQQVEGVIYPAFSNYKFEFGIVAPLAHAHSASLNFLFRYGLSFQKWNAQDTSSVTNPSYAMTYYTVVENSFFVGIEPSVFLSKNLTLYATAGLSLILVPASQSYEYYVNNAGEVQYTVLASNNDAATSIMTSGCSLGLRYYFKIKFKFKVFWMAEPSAGADPLCQAIVLPVRRTAVRFVKTKSTSPHPNTPVPSSPLRKRAERGRGVARREETGRGDEVSLREFLTLR